MIKGKENSGYGAPSGDLLVCFPSRTHLTLTMPKPICSPARHSDSAIRHIYHHQRLKRSTARRGGGNPSLWAKNSRKQQQMRGDGSDLSEPTSPKVTCAGQIKVTPRSSACRNWQSVMEEIEKIHHNRKQKKGPGWAESFGFKKDVASFLTCLRSLRLDFRCFASDPVISSDDEEVEEEIEEDDEFYYHEADQNGESWRTEYTKGDVVDVVVGGGGDDDDGSTAVFSKWFMVLQENNGKECRKDMNLETAGLGKSLDDGSVEADQPSVPPPNALLLMRSRSAPAKGCLQEFGDQKKMLDELVTLQQENQEIVEEEKTKNRRQSLALVMKFDTDFYSNSYFPSPEIDHKFAAPETATNKTNMVAAGEHFYYPLSRSRSCKR